MARPGSESVMLRVREEALSGEVYVPTYAACASFRARDWIWRRAKRAMSAYAFRSGALPSLLAARMENPTLESGARPK